MFPLILLSLAQQTAERSSCPLFENFLFLKDVQPASNANAVAIDTADPSSMFYFGDEIATRMYETPGIFVHGTLFDCL